MASMDKLLAHGQSLWLDYVDRNLLTRGGLKRLVDEGLRGVTSNPTIFHQAITGSADYDEAILDLIQADPEVTAETVYESLAIQDIRMAADILRPVYDATEGADGFVSLEVSPHLAHDALDTMEQARDLWKAVHRDNLMIKVPGTAPGLEAIEALIAEGINVNVTLLFSVPRYEAVFAAYARGLAQNDHPRDVQSVASFFVSRIDGVIDPRLDAMGTPEAAELRGRAAIANARVAYQSFLRMRNEPAFQAQAQRGARVQRPLWASTSAKDPAYSDILYVESLIGPDTVNTVPPATLDAFVAHGEAAPRLIDEGDSAPRVLRGLDACGIALDAVAAQLEADGVDKFVASHDALVEALRDKLSEVTRQDASDARGRSG